MRNLQSSIFRALVAIAVGVLLIKYPDNMVTGIIVAIGVLFLLSGLFSVLSYWYTSRHLSEYKIYDAEGRLVTGQKPDYPIVGIGSMILGGILALMPATFVSFLMYVIGAVLVLGAVGQFLAIIAARRYGKVSLGYFTCPSLILLAGLYVTLKPMSPLSTAMYFLGWISLFYGIVEAVNAILFYFAKRRWEEQHAQLKKENAVIVVDNDSSAQSE